MAERLVSWRNLNQETRPSGSLAVNPKDILDEVRYRKSKNRSNFKPKTRNGKKKQKDVQAKIKKIKHIKNPANINKILYTESPVNVSKLDGNYTDEHEHWGYVKNLTYLSQENVGERTEYTRNQWVSLKNLELPSSYTEHHHLSSDGFFCGVPRK